MRIALLGASFDTDNLGVAALACGTVSSICCSHPDAQISLIDYAKNPSTYGVLHARGVVFVDLVNIRFSWRLYLRNNIALLILAALFLKAIPSRKWRLRLGGMNRTIRSMQQADFACSIAGGDSFSDIYGLGRLVYVSLPQLLALLLDRPLVLVPQTLGPFQGLPAKMIARFILTRARVAYSRDIEGMTAARNLLNGSRARLEFGYDMGFGLEPGIRSERIPAALQSPEPDVPVVGLNVSGLLYMGGYTRGNMFGLKADYPAMMGTLVELFVRRHGCRLMLLPHVYGNSESDLEACREIWHRAGTECRSRLILVDGVYDQHEIKALAGKCDFFVGSRMHACIAALSQAVPAVGLAYSRKFRGVFASIGMEELVVDLRDLDHEGALAAIDRLYRRRNEFQPILRNRAGAARQSVLSLFGGNAFERSAAAVR